MKINCRPVEGKKRRKRRRSGADEDDEDVYSYDEESEEESEVSTGGKRYFALFRALIIVDTEEGSQLGKLMTSRPGSCRKQSTCLQR